MFAPVRQFHWQTEQLDKLPARWRPKVAAEASRLAAAHPWHAHGWIDPAGNRYLATVAAEYTDIGIDAAATDDDIRQLAARLARECMGEAERLHDAGALLARLERIAARQGIEAPDRLKCTPGGRIARLTSEMWWRRRIRKAHGRRLEAQAIALGLVHRKSEIYASDETVQRRGQQKRRNAATLAGLEATNELGDSFTLAELAALSVANPRIRRAELMTRISGFEHVALGVGHVAEFATVTTPSRMHARMAKSGQANPKYDGTSPRDAHAYLVNLWAKIRAALARAGALVYGFRVVEPHHDGTPHWHLLLFMAKECASEFRRIVARYALADSPGEAGAQANRVKFVRIDPARGSAAGYIAKYVAKNIDGHALELDFTTGEDGRTYEAPFTDNAARIEAWAAVWGIRQFQQIGGPPVGVWRELRRIGHGEEGALAEARAAADAGNWRRYVEVQGGPTCERKARPLAVATRMPETLNQYGEAGTPRPWGVLDKPSGRVCESRRFEWRIKRKEAANRAPRTRVNNCTGGVANGRFSEGCTTPGAQESFGTPKRDSGFAHPLPGAIGANHGADSRAVRGLDRIRRLARGE